MGWQTPSDPKPSILRDHPLRLRDHPGLVQGWESVCWGVLGTPFLIFWGFRDLSRFHHCEMRFSKKSVRGADRREHNKIKQIQQKSIVWKYVWFNRVCLGFYTSRFLSVIIFLFLIFPNFPRAHYPKHLFRKRKEERALDTVNYIRTSTCSQGVLVQSIYFYFFLSPLSFHPYMEMQDTGAYLHISHDRNSEEYRQHLGHNGHPNLIL